MEIKKESDKFILEMSKNEIIVLRKVLEELTVYSKVFEAHLFTADFLNKHDEMILEDFKNLLK